MIAEIIKGHSCKNFVEYNEHKVEEGVAKRISGLENFKYASEIKGYLNLCAAKNERVKKNKFQHVMISFHDSDHITTSKFLTIWNKYSEEMNFHQTDHVIYEHNDTHLRHYHIVMPTIDFEGNKISEYKDFQRNRDTCRLIEKEFGLHEIIYDQLQEKKVNTNNQDKYSIYNFVRSAKFHNEYADLIPDSFKNSIIKYKLNNQHVAENYPGYVKTQFKDLQELASSQIINRKKELLDQIRSIKKGTSNFQEFESAIKSNGLYVRRIKSGTSYRIIYGDPSTTTYVKGNKIPKDLRYDYLFGNEQSFSLEDQRKFIRNIAIRSMNKSSSWTEYLYHLEQFNVSIQTKTNKNGIYAYSLMSNNIKEGEWIPASQIDQKLTVGKLKLKFADTTSLSTPSNAHDKKLDPLSGAFKSVLSTTSQTHSDQDIIKDEIRKHKLKKQQEKDERERGEG